MALFIYVAVTGLLACLTSQAIKNYFRKGLTKQNVKFRNLYEDGGFPSSHTAYIVSVNIVCIIYTLIKAHSGSLTEENVWIVISLMIMASLIIRDAVGVRYVVHILCKVCQFLLKLQLSVTSKNDEAYRTIQNLLNNVEIKAGHKPYETAGGFIWGVLIALCTSSVYYNNEKFLLGLIPIMIVYLFCSYKYVEKKMEEEGDI